MARAGPRLISQICMPGARSSSPGPVGLGSIPRAAFSPVKDISRSVALLNRRRRRRFRSATEREMSFTGEKAARGIEPNPTGPGEEDLAPGMQICEISRGPARAIKRFHVRSKLNQVTADKARGQAEVSQQMHQQPGAVAARTGNLG